MNWKTHIKSYQSYLRIERGLSKNTIENYSFDIERLCLFLDENAITVSPIKITEETIQQFIYSVSKEVNPRSQARIISGLKSFFSYLIFEDYRQDNPLELIETPKTGRKLPDTLSVEEIDALHPEKLIISPGPATPYDAGITLEAIVTQLEAHFGWAELAERIPVRCFSHDPSIASSLKFLRKTPWARTQVEGLYGFMLRDIKRAKSDD